MGGPVIAEGTVANDNLTSFGDSSIVSLTPSAAIPGN
jgi:hypothetical protein